MVLIAACPLNGYYPRLEGHPSSVSRILIVFDKSGDHGAELTGASEIGATEFMIERNVTRFLWAFTALVNACSKKVCVSETIN